MGHGNYGVLQADFILYRVREGFIDFIRVWGKVS